MAVFFIPDKHLYTGYPIVVKTVGKIIVQHHICNDCVQSAPKKEVKIIQIRGELLLMNWIINDKYRVISYGGHIFNVGQVI
jgi:hypothetical protein